MCFLLFAFGLQSRKKRKKICIAREWAPVNKNPQFAILLFYFFFLTRLLLLKASARWHHSATVPLLKRHIHSTLIDGNSGTVPLFLSIPPTPNKNAMVSLWIGSIAQTECLLAALVEMTQSKWLTTASYRHTQLICIHDSETFSWSKLANWWSKPHYSTLSGDNCFSVSFIVLRDLQMQFAWSKEKNK